MLSELKLNTVVNIKSLAVGVDCLVVNYSINYFNDCELISKVCGCNTILNSTIDGFSKDMVMREILSWFNNHNKIVYTEAFTIGLEKYLHYTNWEE